jgi:biopolymer transport protein ExbD
VGALITVVALGCAPQVQAQGAPQVGAAIPTTPVANPAATPSAVEAQVQGDAVWLARASYDGDELVAQLSGRRGVAAVLSVRVAKDATDKALAEVLEAAPKAGFEQVSLERGGETLTIATSSGDARARILLWRGNDRLVGYDMQAGEGVSGILGPFDVASNESLKALRMQLTRACQDPCRAELTLLPETPPRMWEALSAWQQSGGSVTTVSSRVLAVAPRPSPSEPSANTVSGRLPPRVIQHIVRSNFEKFRTCYEAGLGRNSALEGRVTLRFVIDRTGKVSNVADGGSDISDPEVTSCVLKAMYTVEFPAPSNGIVTVVYPIKFAPG